MSLIWAFPYLLSDYIPACQPDKLIEGFPIACRAIVDSVQETSSPEDKEAAQIAGRKAVKALIDDTEE